MIRLLLRATPARVRAAPALFALQVAAIALGVGAVLSVQLLNRAALDTLDASLEVISGDAELIVSGLFERHGSVADSAWPAALATPGVASAAPVVRLTGTVVTAGGIEVPVPIWGVDILSGSFDFSAPDAAEAALSPDLFFVGGIALPLAVAERLGVGVGDRVWIAPGSGSGREGRVAGVIPAEGGPSAFLDIAFAQALRGQAGFDRIEVEVRDGHDPDAVSRQLAAAIPGVRIETGGALREQGARLFSAFRLNLLALAAVSLLVGAFLVYTSVRAALTARRQEIGLYRALGAPAHQVGTLLLGEVLVTAFAGLLAGIPIGAFAALASLDRVSATITNFYLLERIDSVTLTPSAVAISVGVAVLAALLGAVPEVLNESRRPPAAMLVPGRAPAHRGPGRLRRFTPALLGGTLIAVAVWPLFIPGAWPARFWGGLGAAAALLVGAALLPGAALALVSPFAAAAGHRSAFGRGMVAALREPRSTAPPVAALVVAVAMLVGVSALIGSFRATLDGWLQHTLAADFYVSRSLGPGRVAAERRLLPSEVMAVAAADPEVRSQDPLRALRLRLDDGLPVTLLGVESSLPEAGERFRFLGSREKALAGFRDGDILVSEPLARRLGLAPDDRLSLPLGGTDHEARIAGVYRDYGNETGAIFVDRDLMNRLWPSADPAHPEVHGVAFHLREGADPEEAFARLERKLAGAAYLVSGAALRGRALGVFDQTMAVTRLFRGFALLIAALGMGLALWTLVRERTPEIALQRALGAGRSQVALGFLGRAALIVGLSLLIGGAAGALLTLLLVEVVNPGWFGWTLDLHWPLRTLIAQGGVVVLAGLLAAALPARLASRVGAAELREET